MATPATGQPPHLVAGQAFSPQYFPPLSLLPPSSSTAQQLQTVPTSTTQNYRQTLMHETGKDPMHTCESIPMKMVEIIDGKHVVRWSSSEVLRMERIENLQYAIVGKFSYG